MNAENNIENNSELPKSAKPPSKSSGGSTRRQSRYNRLQERRAAQKRADNRFYTGVFGLIGVVVMFSILLSAIAINGANVDVSGLEGWTQPWLGSVTKLEAAGVGFVTCVAVMTYLRMRKR